MSRDWSNGECSVAGAETDEYGWSATDLYLLGLLTSILVSVILLVLTVAHWLLTGGLI